MKIALSFASSSTLDIVATENSALKESVIRYAFSIYVKTCTNIASAIHYNVIRAHLHQRGAGPPAGAGSVFRAGRVFTLARVRTQFHFTGAPFRGTGSLIYKYRPISAPYFCGSRRSIAP